MIRAGIFFYFGSGSRMAQTEAEDQRGVFPYHCYFKALMRRAAGVINIMELPYETEILMGYCNQGFESGCS